MYPYGYGYYFDPTYILIIIGVIITMIASSKMNSTFRRYSRVRCHCGLTGSQAAERILNQAGIVYFAIVFSSSNCFKYLKYSTNGCFFALIFPTR